MAFSIEIVGTGLVYRNPKPHLWAIHAMHPSLSLLDESEFTVTFDMGQGAESLDYHTRISRSKDGGKTWELEGMLIDTPRERITTHSIRTSVLSDGRLVGWGGLFYRDDPTEGLLNRENFGYVPVDLFVIESENRGQTWSDLRIIQPPFASPAWEICHPILELPNDDWLAPVAPWRGWDGQLPCGEQAVVLISKDGGRTWPLFGRSFDGRESGLTHFEQSVAAMPDGSLLATAWVYDSKNGKNLPSVYTRSFDGGRSFAAPRPTGFLAQTCKLAALQDGLVLAAYRRDDQPGLWATLAHVEKDRWENLVSTPLWRGAASGMAGEGNPSEELSGLKFGSPSLKQLPDSDVLLVFWCIEDAISNIRWIRLRVNGMVA